MGKHLQVKTAWVAPRWVARLAVLFAVATTTLSSGANADDGEAPRRRAPQEAPRDADDDGFGEVRWAQPPQAGAGLGPHVGATGGVLFGGLVGGAAAVVTGAGVGISTNDLGLAASAGVVAGVAGLFAGTTLVSALWPTELTQGAPVEIGLGAVGGAVGAGVATAGVSITYFSVVYAEAPCCGQDVLLALVAPVAAAGVGAIAGANAMVSFLDERRPQDRPPPTPPLGPQMRRRPPRRAPPPPAATAPENVDDVDDGDDSDSNDDVIGADRAARDPP